MEETKPNSETKKPSNPSAFPLDGNSNHLKTCRGMTLRDYFANSAMQGELSGQYNGNNWANEKDLAQRSYLIADAMLKQREIENL